MYIQTCHTIQLLAMCSYYTCARTMHEHHTCVPHTFTAHAHWQHSHTYSHTFPGICHEVNELKKATLTKVSTSFIFHLSEQTLDVIRDPEPVAKECCKSLSSISNDLAFKRLFVFQINSDLFWGQSACQGDRLERPKKGLGQRFP